MRRQLQFKAGDRVMYRPDPAEHKRVAVIVRQNGPYAQWLVRVEGTDRLTWWDDDKCLPTPPPPVPEPRTDE